jgi:hypothetical protein
MTRRFLVAIVFSALAAAASAGAQRTAKGDEPARPTITQDSIHPKTQPGDWGPFRMGMSYEDALYLAFTDQFNRWVRQKPTVEPYFQNEDVTYFWLNLDKLPVLPDSDLFMPCKGRLGHVAFIFWREQLVRISIRLSCSDRKAMFSQYAMRHGLTPVISEHNNPRYEGFTAEIHQIVGIHPIGGWDIVEFIKKGSPRYPFEPWCNFVDSGCIPAPPDPE